MMNTGNNVSTNADHRRQWGFTLVEVLVAGMLLIIICVGVLQTYVHAIKINRGNYLRMQALAVLQREVEYYRSLAFVPSPTVTSADLGGKVRTNTGFRDSNPAEPSKSIRFDIFVTIDNDVETAGIQTAGNDTTKFKEIIIEAIPQVTPNEGWLQNLNTTVTVQRVRAN